MSHLIAPSLLSCDFANIQQDVEMLNQSKADWFHLDVMDGHFVPNISFGIPVIKAIKKHAKKPLDVHLMIENPENYIDAFKKAGADMLTIHCETSPHLHRSAQLIREAGIQAGVALNPHSPVSLIEHVITEIDILLLMSVNPGFGGQQFIPNTIKKLKQARQLIDDTGSGALIEIDGGVNLKNAPELLAKGADVLVAGSFVFHSADPESTIEALKNCKSANPSTHPCT